MPFFKKINLGLSILPIMLFSLGYVIHLSTSPQRAQTQFLYFILSYTLFWFVSLIDYRLIGYASRSLYIFILISLVLVFVLGETTLGAARWLSFGFFNFQPSEFAKFGLAIFISVYISDNWPESFKIKHLIKLIIPVVAIILMVFMQPDLGSAIILFILFAGTLFVGGLNWIYYAISFVVLGLLSSPIWYLLKEYQKHRILVFLNPTLDTLGRGYNVIQSLISVGSGGIVGKGFGRGTQSHLNFLPIYWTDFIFAAFAEEWGFVGVLVMLILFVALFSTILSVAYKAQDRLGMVLSSAVFFILFSQFVINIGMNLGMLPVTGIPLPLISYGGTSMLTSFMLLGLVHSVWLNRKGL
jgi:rod shape determining protein RodA